MKKLSKVLAVLLAVILAGGMTTACNKKIDGARFIVTKAILTATYMEGKETEEDKTDDVFKATMTLTFTINVTEKDAKILVERSEFKFSHNTVSIVLKTLSNTVVSSITANGPKSEPEEGESSAGTVVTWGRLDVDFGEGLSRDQISEIQSKLRLTYKGVNLYMPLAIGYK